MVAAAVAGGAAVAGVAGSAISANAAGNAADQQAQSAASAQQQQMQMFQQMQQNLSPYTGLGQSSINQLQSLLGSGKLGQQFSFNPTESQLTQTPGYQFALGQGLNTLNNQFAAKGLNLSGAQAKGLTGFATGLADQTYQNQYQNALNNFKTNYGVNENQFNQLSGLVGLGENAAAGVGNAGVQTGQSISNLITGAGNAQAAGTIGSANAFNSGLGSLGSAGSLYSLMQNGGFGGGGNGNIYAPQAPTDLAAQYGVGGNTYGFTGGG